MDNLRIISVNVQDSITIIAKFTHKLDLSIGTSNITITSQINNVPSPTVNKVDIVGDTITITSQPLTPLASYLIKFQSTTISFKSVNGDAILYDDGITNQQIIIGPTEAGNVIQDFLINYLRETPMDVYDNTTLVNKIIQSLSLVYSKALYDIRQVKNENYLSFDVTDELVVRQQGPFDRLIEEGAYHITRVGKTRTGTGATLNFEFTEFPKYPVTLLSTTYDESLTVNFEDAVGFFNINSFILNVSKLNVSKLKSVIFYYSNANPPYSYPVETLGYQIKDSRYDQSFGFSYLTLEDNQFRISETVLNDVNFFSENILRIDVEYEYRNLGRIIDSNSVEASTTLFSVREALPPIINVFNLKYAPIVNSSGNIPTTGGVTFIDPNAFVSTSLHPAFKYELPFRLNALPNRIGEYSIDYETGTVYVYGDSSANEGTGPEPPLATYRYKFIYVNEVDYVYDDTTSDLVSLPNGNLRDEPAKIVFNYEEVLIPNIDYKANVHEENLSERVENRLGALNIIKTLKSPITNVFRIFNETSGEIYTPTRWNNDKIYFSYNNSPNITALVGERVSFKDTLNEILFVNNQLTNAYTIKIFKCLLSNNNLIAATEDNIGSSINTSVKFSDTEVFIYEKWFDESLTETQNIDLLSSIGEYKIDYQNGIVYCAVSALQTISIGTLTYKIPSISPIHTHVISVDDVYYQTSILNPKDKSFDTSSFGEGFIIPVALDVSDESFLNKTPGAPYQINSTEIGAFVNATFVPGVTNNIKFIRGVFELDDLQNNILPINFVESSTFSERVITVLPIEKSEYNVVNYNISDGYFVTLSLNLQYISPNITFTPSIIRNSDMAELWDGGAVVVTGDSVKLTQLTANVPNAGDSVTVTYSLAINDLSRVIVDYNKGDLYADYTYLADEIIVSYEYGENFIDFRESNSIDPGTSYYVNYKVGALRDALLKNFGSLINIPELTSFDVNLVRERYRDALSAALESFVQGPTVTALKNIVAKIAHIEPEIIESVFQNWSLGSSFLNPRGIESAGAFELLPAKYGNGVLIDTDGQSVTFPTSSNLRLEKGSFECWVLPEWDGIDNDSELKFTITRDGYAINSSDIFIGSAEYHPELELDNTFTINKLSNTVGIPNKNKDGIFIYYDYDSTNTYKRWFVDVVDGYSFGHVDGYSTKYNVKINTSGIFYDVKSSDLVQPGNMRITSGTGTLNFSITDTLKFSEGITFVADREHYLLDFGEKKNKNRFSIYKDPSGYMNFRIIDNQNNTYSVSADVSSWKAHQKYHVATSWALNSKINRDELHLFIDGEEVPNIIKYGNKVSPYLHERFRTINPEEIAGLTPKTIIGSIDLVTTSGSSVVTSSINFSAYGIIAGDTIFIDEDGFNPAGYTILIVAGQTLTLNSSMPLTLTQATYSVNRVNLIITSEIDIYPNIAVSTISSILDGYDLSTTISSSTVTSALVNFTTANVEAGYLIRITGVGFESHYVILSVSGNSLVLNDTMPATLSGLTFNIYQNVDVEIPGVRALRPSYALSKDGYDGYYNNILTLNSDVTASDLILIKTLGVNHRRVKQKYYQWGDYLDGYTGNDLNTLISSNQVSATYANFGDGYIGITPGHLIQIGDGYHVILGVSGSTLTLNDTMPATLSGLAYHIYQGTDIIKTALPPPISLDEVKITRVILKDTLLSSKNSTLAGNLFTSKDGNLYPSLDGYVIADQPSISDTGRTLAVTISGVNLNFATSVVVTITGTDSGGPLVEPLTFTEIGLQNTVGKFITITSVIITGEVTSITRSFMSLSIKEAHTITTAENSDIFATIKYSYQSRAGIALAGSASTVTDGYVLFSSTDIGNYLVISSPATVAGTYLITGVSDDRHSVIIDGTLSSFTAGIYQVLNTASARSGFQNGYFLLEVAGFPGVPYPLNKGLYEFDFYTYLTAKFAPLNYTAYIGSDMNKENLINSVVDELKIYNNKLTDIRVGETAQAKQKYITKDFNSLKELSSDKNTLVLAHFDTYPFVNSADFYIISEGKGFVQSDNSVNDNFGQSLCITDKPFIIDNNGVLNTKKEGTIEFWVNPLFDSYNDPNYRFYFDAAGVNIETVTSLNDVTVQIVGRASQILSVKLKNGDQSNDYFAGGAIETDTSGAIQETTLSINDSTAAVSKNILQVVTVKIVGDPTGTDYFSSGTIGTDHRTIYLGRTLPSSSLNLIIVYKSSEGGNTTINKQVIRLKKRLPNEQTPVIVTYIPSGLHGDRMSIYKDPSGYVNFNVRANDFDYQVRAPIFWTQNSWHRVKATFKLNGGKSNDQIRLFVDGYEYQNILFGTDLLFGSPNVVGASYTGSSGLRADIKFKDIPNELFIGTEYNNNSPAHCLIDNLRVSNLSRPVFSPFGESIDVNYNSNTGAAFPVTLDLYTTFLLDFNTILLKNDDFVTLKNKKSGMFDFSINIFDSFGIVNSSSKVQEILETLIKTLKPANSRVFIQYIV